MRQGVGERDQDAAGASEQEVAVGFGGFFVAVDGIGDPYNHEIARSTQEAQW